MEHLSSAAGDDIRAAIDSLIKHQPLDRPMRPSMGCGIKWHPSKQPAQAT